jgi:hypothetical protein
MWLAFNLHMMFFIISGLWRCSDVLQVKLTTNMWPVYTERNGVFGIKVPPKVRVFWWRVSNEFIPSMANLHRWHREPLSTVSFCGVELETTFHALTRCTYARQF